MISNSQDNALNIVAQAVESNPQWERYGKYCLLRVKGIRKQAFQMMNTFLAEAKQWSNEDKKAFVQFLMPLCEDVSDADYGPFPQPIRDQLIKPTLENWCTVETVDSNPFRWYGKYFQEENYLFKALVVNPKDDKARREIVSRILYKIDFATHHLPDYYIGEPAYALKWRDEVRVHIALFEDDKIRRFWAEELDSAMVLVENYVAWKASGHSNFEQWGKENNKVVSSGVMSYYYQ